MPYKILGKTSEYIRSLLPQNNSPQLREVLQYAEENNLPVLLPETAVVLAQLVMLKQPKKVLEIGTSVGYSTRVILQNSLSANVYTIESNESIYETSRAFFIKHGLADRVNLVFADATEILSFIDSKFDFIFLDGPKAQYVEYLPFLARYLTSGGVLVCDNVLFNGMVAGETEIARHKGGLVKKLDSFLRELMKRQDLTSSIIPVGDGISVSIKR